MITTIGLIRPMVGHTRSPRRHVLALTTGVLLVLSLHASAATPTTTITSIALAGSTNLAALPVTQGTENDLLSDLQPDVPPRPTINAVRLTHLPVSQGDGLIPRPTSSSFATSNAGFSGFDALNQRDQRLADQGNQLTLEPPDQALCVGAGFVLEVVNDALAVYDQAGNQVAGPVASNRFFGLPSAFNRTTGVVGPFLSDPRCYFDPDTQRWFVVLLELGNTGKQPVVLTGPTAILIAVSTTSDPTGDYRIYSLDTTHADDPDCPCYTDFPGIGADANGFYVSGNEFSISTSPLVLKGAEIFAMSKLDLVEGTLPPVERIADFDFLDGGFTIRPATSPNAHYEAANGGTEYLVSGFPFSGIYVDNRLAVWALTNTSTLLEASPSLSLTRVVLTVQDDAYPPLAQQKPGPLPLAEYINATFRQGNGPEEHEQVLEVVSRMPSQVVWANGKLWTAKDTGVQPPMGPPRAGSAWYVLQPSFRGGELAVGIVNQGYVAVSWQDLTNPAIAVNDAGQAVLGFTLVGRDFYPSAAYVNLNATTGTGPVYIAALGFAPNEGVVGLAINGGGGVARFGDYGAAVAAQNGTLWLATEYISSRPRTIFENWGTFITHVIP